MLSGLDILGLADFFTAGWSSDVKQVEGVGQSDEKWMDSCLET